MNGDSAEVKRGKSRIGGRVAKEGGEGEAKGGKEGKEGKESEIEVSDEN